MAGQANQQQTLVSRCQPLSSFCCPKGFHFPSPLQANTSRGTVWALTSWTGLTWPPHSVRDQLSMCALSLPLHRHQAAAVPSCVTAPHGRSQTARNHPFWNSFLHCLPSNHTPFHILSFLPSRKALPFRGMLFCCFPAGKLHVGTSHPQPEPVRI